MRLFEYYSENKFNPTTFDLSCEARLKTHFAKRFNLYSNRLCLPPMIWENASVLEVGSSSGENALPQAKLGAEYTFVEPIEEACDSLRELFKRCGLKKRIRKIHVAPFEEVHLEEKFDVVIAEGLVPAFTNRRQVVRKLFNLVAENGVLILSTSDHVGSVIEFFKAAIARLYCQRFKVESLDEKVEVIRPFFEPDFNTIPHSRPFSSWAKDMHFNPLFEDRNFYSFPEILSDLEGLSPVYFSSWPDYHHPNDLTWHKNTLSYQERVKLDLSGYEFKRSTFILGQTQSHEEAVETLNDPKKKFIVGKALDFISALGRLVRKEAADMAPVLRPLRRLYTVDSGDIVKVVKEMIEVLSSIDLEMYVNCSTLRKYWGVPNHYIILRRWNDHFE